MRWIYPPINESLVQSLSRNLSLLEPTAHLLSQIGLRDFDEARVFLEPRLSYLSDPFLVTHMREGVERLRRAMENAEEILVFGDYDVDGVTSTVLLLRFLHRFGLSPRYVVPRRLEEGYGLSVDALQRAFEEKKPDLVIAVDCGTGSCDAVKFLTDQGIDVLILDHHQSKDALPEKCILINPHVYDPEDAPWKHCCAVGIVFKFAHAVLKALREEGDALAHEIQLREYLDLVAMGTIADLVPLLGENRILAKRGLEFLRTTRRLGISALFEVGGMRLGEEVTPFDISFRIGPRINASGRLADASEPIEMLLSNDWQSCRRSAQMLDAFNRERQTIERAITAEAEKMVEDVFADAPGLILYEPSWHPGVVGIVASRISQKYHRPTLVLGAENGMAKGSGRSIHGVDLVETLKPCSDLLDRWGGHPMAVGVSVQPEHLDALRGRFAESVLRSVEGSLPERELVISGWIRPEHLSERLLQELALLAPFGQGNPEPVFALREAQIRYPSPFGRGHLRFQVEAGAGILVEAVAWNVGERIPPVHRTVDLAFRFNWNVWNGRRSPRLTVMDWR